MIRLCFLSFLLLASSLLQAQTAFNVKLKSQHRTVQNWLQNQQQAASQKQALPTDLATKYPFLVSLEYAQPLFQKNKKSNVFTLESRTDQPANTLMVMRASGLFEWVDTVRRIRLHAINTAAPNDDSIAQQWYHSYVKTFEAWDDGRGKNEIRVGFIDTGLDYHHPEFEGQIAINAAEDLNNNGKIDPWPSSETRNGVSGDFDEIDSDGNGYTDDVIGYDFTDQPRSPFGGDYIFEDSDPLDDDRHGTLVAGCIAAQADNGWGGSGIAPNCRLVALRAFSASGIGEDDDISRAIIYAADNGIKILNMSFGDIYPSLVMHEAIRYAHSKGVVMIGSAGNGTGDQLHYPSGFNEVISVSGSTYDESDGREFLWPLSSYGVTVDLCAPAAGIFTTTRLDTSAKDGKVKYFDYVSGTSFSAPIVSAAVALIFAKKGTLTPQQVRGILTSSADDISQPGWDHFTGAGRLNIRRALDVQGASHVQIISPENDRGASQSSVAIIGTVLDPQFLRYHLEYRAGLDGTGDWEIILSDQNLQLKDDTLGVWDLINVAEGDYTLRLRVERTDGFTTEDRIRFVRDISAPKIEVKVAHPVWDNQTRKMLVIFRSDDQGEHQLQFRPKGSTAAWSKLGFDRSTRNGEFLIENTLLQSGDYDFFIHSTNLAGLEATSDTLEFNFQADFVNRGGFAPKKYGLPMGRFLPETFDFNQNGKKEVVMSVYDRRLSFGKTKFFEFNGTEFEVMDSIASLRVLIPKDVADTDGNGQQELLCSVNDSIYVFEQSAAGLFPKKQIYTDFANKHFAASFADVDGNGDLNLITKDFKDYQIFSGGGSSYNLSAILEDKSPDYQGSVAPRVLVDDFDGDGKMETVFGDFDGDISVYEYRGSGNFVNTFIDSTSLTKSSAQLTKGDFDGDGKPEIFVAVHSSSLRNADFEYDTPHWWLRIFKSNADDQYAVVWEDYLFDIDNENFNAATAGDLDNDGADELVFTTFPRTYIIDYQSNSYEMRWFFYGAICTHHIIADFDGNGIKELGLGRGDSTLFWEMDANNAAPPMVTSLQGTVLGSSSVHLDWPASEGATEYLLIYRDIAVSPPAWAIKTAPGSATATDVTGLDNEKDYRFIMQAIRGTDSSFFGNAIVRKPHPNNKVDSIVVINSRQISVWFSWPVTERESDKVHFVLNGEHTPRAITQAGDQGHHLILSFAKNLNVRSNLLEIFPLFLDVDYGIYSPLQQQNTFDYQPQKEETLYLTRWKALSEHEAILQFNYPVKESDLNLQNFELLPVGNIVSVSLEAGSQNVVRVKIEQARFGALGYPLSVRVSPNVCAINDACILKNEGDVATFTDFKDDFAEAMVYPNPVILSKHFEGLRFANLPQTARIKVMTASGRFINEFEETDGDGGYTWNMLDQNGNKIMPGVYLYYLSELRSDGKNRFLGKFSVVE